MLARARWVSFASRWGLEQVAPMVPSGARLKVVGGGVADELYELERAEGEDLLYFGRLDIFHKGLDTLLEAFGRMRARRPGLRLRIAGRGKDREAVERLAAERGLGGAIVMEGAVSDSRRLSLFREARVLLMPSRFEGFGMVAAEAMAAGVPLVATEAGSLPEVVGPPEGGILVPVDDAEALATEALALLDDPARRAALSRSARRAAERFRWDAVAERHYDFLQMIAADAARKR